MWESILAKWKNVQDIKMSYNNDQLLSLTISPTGGLILWNCDWDDQPCPISPPNHEKIMPEKRESIDKLANARDKLNKKRDEIKRIGGLNDLHNEPVYKKDSIVSKSTNVSNRQISPGKIARNSCEDVLDNMQHNFHKNMDNIDFINQQKAMQEMQYQQPPPQLLKKSPIPSIANNLVLDENLGRVEEPSIADKKDYDIIDEFGIISTIQSEHQKFTNLMEEKLNYLSPIMHWLSSNNIKAAVNGIEALTEPVII